MARGVAALTMIVPLAGASGASAQAPTLAPEWNQLSPGTSPPQRYSHAMTYDAGHGQVVLFGGFGQGGYLSDTWLWNGSNWSQVSPATIPSPARTGHAMAYDATAGKVIMFGGFYNNGNTLASLGDTWLWNGTNWSQPTITGGSPPSRSDFSMVYDAAQGNVVLFGGNPQNGLPLSDTWVWNGSTSTWTNENPANGPSARDSYSMAYDAALGEVVLFGGFDEFGNYLNDTWVWNGTTWSQATISGSSPSGRDAAGMVYDPALGGEVLFGGVGSGDILLGDTWVLTWNGSTGTWTQLTTATSPSAREIPNGLVYDAQQGQEVLFGGYNGGSGFGDTWTFADPQNFGNVNVCPSGVGPSPCSSSLTLTYNVATTTDFGTPKEVTQGAPGPDFNDSPTTSCSGTVSAGSTCFVDVTFAPQAPGLRQGAVELFDNSENLLTSTPIYGNGQGPEIAFGPGAQSLVNTGSVSLTTPNGAATDVAGNLYIADGGTGYNGQVWKVAPSGAVTTVGSGLDYPQGLAVDGAGDVFIADNNHNEVFEVTPAGVQTSISLGLGAQLGVAVDGAGDLFISDFNAGVYEAPASCNYTCKSLVYTAPSGLSPVGLAVDAAGDLFVAALSYYHTEPGLVEEIPAGCTSSGCQIAVGTGWYAPEAVAVDAAGDVFVADELPDVVEVPAGCASASCQITLSQALAYGIAVDAKGDLFIPDRGTDANAGHVIEISHSQAPSLSFASTNVGSTSSNSPQTVSIENIGNTALNFSAIAYPADFPEAPGQASDCATASPLNAGGLCTLTIDFTPLTGGPAPGTLLSEAVGLTDNALNVTGATQRISVQGTAVQSQIMVPNVVNDAQSAAESAITAAGLTVGTETTSSSNTVPSGDVISESPAAGTLVAPGSAVGLVISTGPAMVAVPNVVDLTGTAAATAITGAGLDLGTQTSQASSIVPAGSVISETPAAGTQTTLGTAVSLVLSTGQPPAANQLSLLNNYFVTGDYVSAGVNLHGMGQGGIATGTITIPKDITGPGGTGVPDGADILAAYLYWEVVENTTSPSSASVNFMGYSITGQQIGSDQPYTDGVLSGTLRVYRADVNTYIPVGANGIRFASGNFTVSLPDGGGTVLPLSEGASLVVIYRVLSPSFPLKSVVIYDGSAIPTTGALSQTVQGFYDAAAGTGEITNLYAGGGAWNNSSGSASLAAHASQYTETLSTGNAYAAVILSTPVNNTDGDGILDAWKAGPSAPDPNAGNPGYYDVKTGSWVGLPGAVHGHKDLFVQLDYMCSALLSDGTCDFTQENLYPSPDANGNDPLAMVTQAFAAMTPEIYLHLEIGNPILETTCADSGSQLCEFPNEPGVLSWDGSLQISKVWPRNFASCASGGDCTARFPYGQKDSYHYVLFGFSLAIPAWNTRYGTLTSIMVSGGTTTITTADRGSGINACPSRVTITGVLGMPSLNGVYNTTGCADTKTITIATPPGVTNGWTYPNSTLPEPVIGLTSGTVTSISGYSDLGGSDSAVTLGLWETAPDQDMSKRANVIAGTLYHEIGHTLGLTHGGLYYDGAPASYIPTFEANCKPNFQSVMNYLFQLDGVGPSAAVAYSNQTLTELYQSSWGSVTQLLDTDPGVLNPTPTFSTSAWYTPTLPSGSTESAATLHCDGTPLTGDTGYRVDGTVDPLPSEAWAGDPNIAFDGQIPTQMRGYNDWNNVDLRQVGATGGEFAALASQLSFGSSAAPLNVAAGGNVTLGSGGTVTLGSGGNVTLGSGGNVTLGSGGTITLGSGGNVTLGSGGTVTLSSGGTITSGGSSTSVGAGTYTIASGGTITLGSGGNITLGSGGNVTLGSGGTITLGSGGNVTLGSGGNVTLGSGGSVTLGGDLSAGSGGNVTLGSGGNVTLGSGGNVTLGSGGSVTLLGSTGNVTLGSGGTITLGSGGNVTLGSGGNVTLGSGGTITLGSGGTPMTVGPGTYTFSAGGTITLGSGGNVTLGSGGNVSLGSGGTITLGSGGNVTLGSGGNVTLGSGGVVALGGSGGNVTLGSGGNVTLGSGGNVTLGSGGASTTDLTYDMANSIVRPPPSATYTVTPQGIVVSWSAPAFGVVQTYSIYRSSNGQPPVLIGSVSGGGANGFAPQTTFTDTTPDLTASTLVYTITTTLVPDTGTSTQRQSQPSPPAVLTLDQTIGNLSLPNQAVLGSTQPATVSAMAETNGSANGQLVSFSASGPCSAGNSAIDANGVSSATITLINTGSCTITASQAGSTSPSGGNSYNAATPVQGTFTIQPQGSTTNSQTITFGSSPNVQYGGTFSLSATSSSGLQVSLSVPPTGPCTITSSLSSGGTTTVSGAATAAGLCTVTAAQAGNSTYGAASVTESFSIAPAVLTVTATSITATYGHVPALPASLTYSLSGYVNHDATANPPVVTGAPVLSTTATAASNTGIYPITIATGTLAAANYSFLYVPGTVTIDEAPAITSVSSATFTVGTFGSFPVTTTGFPAPAITESGALPNGVTLVDNHNGTATLSGKATVSGIYTITITAQNGVSPAATQTFTLTSETTVPASSTTCSGVYIGTFSGNITVSSGQNCIFLKGGVTGNITETGGNIELSNATVGGSITITAGTYSIGPTTKITGSFTAQNIPTGAAQDQLCGASVGGNLVFQSVGTAATIGAGTLACPGNSITGSVTLQANKAAVALDGNTVKGSVTDQSNTASTTLSGNTIGGSLTDQSNSGASVVSLNSITGNLVDQSNSASSILSQNTVGGSLTDQSNTGSTQVSSNKVTAILLCQTNKTITGGGNTASKKEGQCATF